MTARRKRNAVAAATPAKGSFPFADHRTAAEIDREWERRFGLRSAA